MGWRRSPFVLAMLTALLMAPSTVFGAPPNELRSAKVAPSSGSSDTPFVLTVHYVSRAGNPASAVTAEFASSTVALTLIAGTPVDGVWTATTRLPEGSISVTFQASAAKGPKPKLTVSSVIVTSPSSPSPSVPGGSSPSADGSGHGGGPPGSAAPAPTASRPASGTPEPRATTRPTTPRSSAPAPRPASPGTHGGGRPDGNGGSRPSATLRPGGRPAPEGTAGAAGPLGQPAGELGDEPRVAMLMGVLAVAALALLAAGWIATGGRRTDDEREPVTEAGLAGTDPALAAIPTVERRARRRARLRASDDPILAAFDLPEEAEAAVDAAEPATGLEGRLPRHTQRVKRKGQ